MQYFEKSLRNVFGVIVLIYALGATAHASENASDEWQMSLTPYAWLSGQSGTVATLPGFPPADIDIDFWDDIVDNLNGALFLIAEIQKDRFGAYAHLAYVDIEDDSASAEPLVSSIVSQTKSWMFDIGGVYRLLETSEWFSDLFVGGRLWSVDSSLTLEGPLGAVSLENSEDWIDPVIGVKMKKTLTDSGIFISGFSAIGGFGVSSDFLLDLNISLGYSWSESISTSIGYRYLSVDYDNGDFLYDVEQQGPTLGFSWRF